jgi:hypothetical protein
MKTAPDPVPSYHRPVTARRHFNALSIARSNGEGLVLPHGQGDRPWQM